MFAAKRAFGRGLVFLRSTILTDWLWTVAFPNATCAIALPLLGEEASILPLSEQVPPLVVVHEGFEPITCWFLRPVPLPLG